MPLYGLHDSAGAPPPPRAALADRRPGARAQRKAWAALVDGVAAAGGEALVFSAAHASGEQLNQLSGVAAVLRFPLPELEDAELDA